MKILITGASGFLGRFLRKSLAKLKHELVCVSSKDCDLTDADALNNLKLEELDQIYHLAAWTQAGDFCLHNPASQWLINQKINTNMLSYWVEKQPNAKLICMGTSCSYDPSVPLEEKNYLVGEPIDSLYTYAMTKRMLLIGLEAIHRQFKLNYLYIVPSTLYGPSYHLDGRQMHFIFDLIRKILKGKLYQNPVVLWGNGYQKRELMHVEDFVSKLIELSDKVDSSVINLGSGNEYSIRDFAKIICDIVDYEFKKIYFDTTKYVGAKSKVLSINKVKKILNSYQLRSLEQGLNETVNWFLNNKESLLNS